MKRNKLILIAAFSLIVLCGCNTQAKETTVAETENTTTIATEETEAATAPIVFNGIENHGQDKEYGNLTINMRSFSADAPFCAKSPDEIYFAGKERRLCSYIDGKATVLSENSAICINVMNDSIYYICPQKDNCGPIYRYDKVSKTDELYLSVDAEGLYVNENGLYYVTATWEKNEGYTTARPTMHFRGFDSAQTLNCDYTQLLEYGDYHLIWDKENSSFCLKSEADTVAICPDSEVLAFAAIYKDKLYSAWHSFIEINLVTGEKRKLTADEITGEENAEITGYTVLGENVYFANRRDKISVLDKSGNISYIFHDGFNDDEQVTIYGLYTDGEALYGQTGDGYLYKLEISENETYTAISLEDEQ